MDGPQPMQVSEIPEAQLRVQEFRKQCEERVKECRELGIARQSESEAFFLHADAAEAALARIHQSQESPVPAPTEGGFAASANFRTEGSTFSQ